MFLGNLADAGEGLFAFFGENERMAAAIGQVGAPFGEAKSVEFVEEGHEAAGHHAQAGGERLLGEAGAGRENVQDAGVRGSEVELAEALGELMPGVAAELSEKEGCAEGAGSAGWRG